MPASKLLIIYKWTIQPLLFTFADNKIAGMVMIRVSGEKMPHKIAVMRDRFMKSSGVYSYFGV